MAQNKACGKENISPNLGQEKKKLEVGVILPQSLGAIFDGCWTSVLWENMKIILFEVKKPLLKAAKLDLDPRFSYFGQSSVNDIILYSDVGLTNGLVHWKLDS